MVTNRETWLNDLAALMAPRFAELGAPLPPFRVSVGFTSLGAGGGVAGECWDKRGSADDRYEIFLSPHRADSLAVASTMAHELVHAAVGISQGHKGEFARVALALGLPRPLTHAVAPTEQITAWIQPLIDTLGPLPHAALDCIRDAARPISRGKGGVSRGDGGDGDTPQSTRPKTQTTRMRKCECLECGYVVRITAKWLAVGLPHCPEHGAMAEASAQGAD